MLKKAGETALVTGASEGIGYELSKLFARDGYDLVLVARNEEKLNRISDDFSRMYGISAKVIVKDLSKSTAPDEIYDELKRDGVEVDVLVNNAGYTIYGPFAETDISKELEMLQVLLLAPTRLTKLFLKDMLKKDRGKIMNLGSVASFAAFPLSSVYSAAKAYVLFFSQAIAEELAGSNVTVTTLCPGSTRTQFFTRASMDDTRLGRYKFMNMSAEKVAEIGYRALMENKRFVVPGVFNKFTVFMTRLLPRAAQMKIAKTFSV
jgi:short-subunit dehydrogenase